MTTVSRSPKVANNVLKYKLRPVLDRIAKLEEVATSNAQYVEEVISSIANLRTKAAKYISNYKEKRYILDTMIDAANIALTGIIKNNMYNPNAASVIDSSDSDVISIEQTSYIYDKTINCIGYGLVDDGKDYRVFCSNGQGIVVDTVDTAKTDEREFRSPSVSTLDFPSYYVNDFLLVDSSTALIATNNGVVEYKIKDDSYKLYEKSSGLPSNRVYRIIKVSNASGTITGYLAGTETGIAYSPNGSRWVRIDNSFDETISSISTIEKIETTQNLVFIGTSNGIYYIDIGSYIDGNENIKVSVIPGLNYTLPTSYINGIAYNTEKDYLAITTIAGLSILKGVKSIIENGTTVNANAVDSNGTDIYTLYTISNGLNSSSCYDVVWTTDGKLLIATSNGCNVSSNLLKFTSITKTANTYNIDSKMYLDAYICNRIIRQHDNVFSILHSTGYTEGIDLDL